MSHHLADTKITLAQCNRCLSYVLLADSSGLRVAADPAPASREAYIEALASGRRTFDLIEQAGRPHKLRTRRLSDRPPTFGPTGAQEAVQRPLGGALHLTRPVLVEHGCAVNARNAVRYQEVEAKPTATVCDTWKASGWVPPPGKCGRERNPEVTSCGECDSPPFLAASPGHERVGSPSGVSAYTPPATLHTERPECDSCGRRIMPGEEFWGFQHGEDWIYAAHA